MTNPKITDIKDTAIIVADLFGKKLSKIEPVSNNETDIISTPVNEDSDNGFIM